MVFWKKPDIAGSVSILVPTMFDSRYIVELCLKSIIKYSDYPDYRIVVCDSGVDETTGSYLSDLAQKGEIELIKATDWQRPKDDLVRAVKTDYYLLMHDDTQVLKSGWLTRRLRLMCKDEKNAIVGTIVENYNRTKRFFPLGLLVKTSVSRELDLVWGKQQDIGFDTGALAYRKFFSQDTYKFASYKVSRDIRHFAEMTWPMYHTKEDYSGLDEKIAERKKKIEIIKDILANNRY